MQQQPRNTSFLSSQFDAEFGDGSDMVDASAYVGGVCVGVQEREKALMPNNNTHINSNTQQRNRQEDKGQQQFVAPNMPASIVQSSTPSFPPVTRFPVAVAASSASSSTPASAVIPPLMHTKLPTTANGVIIPPAFDQLNPTLYAQLLSRFSENEGAVTNLRSALERTKRDFSLTAAMLNQTPQQQQQQQHTRYPPRNASVDSSSELKQLKFENQQMQG